MPCSNVPRSVTPKISAARWPTSVRRPDVEPALLTFGVGVERRGEPAVVGQQVCDHPVARLDRDPAGQRASGQSPPMGVHPSEQSVVVQHLLEVRHHPVVIDRVAGEASGELVVHPASSHALARDRDDLAAASGAGSRRMAEQELQRPSTAGTSAPHRTRPWRRRGPPKAPARRRRAASLEMPRPGRDRPVARRELADHVGAGLLDLLAPGRPGVDDRLENPPERRHAGPVDRREVGPAEERLGVSA